MFKKGLAVVLCAVLLCGALPAWAAPGDITLFERDPNDEGNVPYVRSMAVVGDTVYLLADGLYCYRVGEEKPTLLDSLGMSPLGEEPEQGVEETAQAEAAPEPADRVGAEVPSGAAAGVDEIEVVEAETAEMADTSSFSWDLLIGGERLGVLDTTAGKYRLWDGSAFAAEETQLDWNGMTRQQEEYVQTLETPMALMDGGVLYLLTAKDFDTWGEYNIRRFDSATGEAKEASSESVQQIAPYKPGKFVALRMDMEKWVPSIVVVDAETCAIEQTLYTWERRGGMAQVTAVAYDAASDTIYCAANGEILPVKEGALGEAVAYLAVNGYMGSGFAAFLPSGHIVLRAYEGVYVRNLDPQYKPGNVLRIGGSYMDDVTLAFARENPDIAVVMADVESWQSKNVIDAMVSQDRTVDLLQVPGRGTLRALREKGYLVDLSSSQKLMDSVKAMYPQVQEAVLQDGKLVAFPADLYASFWRVNTAALEELGLEAPETIGDWLELTGRWFEEDMAEEHSQYTLYDEYINKETLLYQIIQQYAIQYERPGEPLRFNAPELRAALEQWEALPEFGPEPDRSGESVTIVRSGGEASRRLIELSAYGFTGGYDSGEEGPKPVLVAPPGFAAGDESTVDGLLITYIVNPNSPNAETAMRYLEYLADHADARQRYALRPDLNEPVMYPFVQKYISEQEQELEECRRELETAKEEDRQGLQETIDTLTQNLEQTRRHSWMISAEELAEYRALASRIRLNSDSMFFSYDDASMEETWKALQRYGEGQIKLDEMLREMDKKIQMIFLEGQ